MADKEQAFGFVFLDGEIADVVREDSHAVRKGRASGVTPSCPQCGRRRSSWGDVGRVKGGAHCGRQVALVLGWGWKAKRRSELMERLERILEEAPRTVECQ